jgi:hypothetical protein
MSSRFARSSDPNRCGGHRLKLADLLGGRFSGQFTDRAPDGLGNEPQRQQLRVERPVRAVALEALVVAKLETDRFGHVGLAQPFGDSCSLDSTFDDGDEGVFFEHVFMLEFMVRIMNGQQ